MRNLLLTLRSALLLLLLAGTVPNAMADQFVENGIRYETRSDNTVAVISNYESSYQGDITIPKTVSHKVYSGYEEFTLTFIVSSIESYAFSGCTGLTSVSMPNSIKTIGYNAFYGCSALSSIDIPNGVESIGAAAFQNCAQLLSVTMPNSVRTIGDNLFYGCTRLKDVTLSSSIRELKGTFFGCTSLSSIEVPYSVTTLDCAFTGCTSLSNVILPGSLTTIGSRSFEDCSSLTGLYIPNSVTLIKEKAFNNAGLTALEIPCTTTSIGLDAFINCRNLASVTSRAVNPPVMANRGCFSNDTYNQASLYVPNIVKNQYENANWWSAFVNTIGKTEYDNVYDGASNSIYYRITGDNTVSVTFKDGNYNSYSGSVTIPATVTIGGKIYQVNEIGYNAFKDCVGLTSVTIPTSVTKIASQAFYNAGLTTLNLPNGLQYIGADAFNGCNRLTSLTIPVSVVHIGDKAFDGCNGITSLTWNAKNCHTNGGLPTANLTSVTIGSQVETLPVKFVSRSSISQITLPQSLTAIGDSAFYYCNGLTALTIPSGLTSIGTNAFGNCTNLSTLHWNAIMCATNGDMYTYGITTATIGNEVEMLPSNFVSQSQITSISFPASVKQISDYAFSDCVGLTELVIPETIQSIGSYAFYGCYGINRLTWNAIDCDNLGMMSSGSISQVTIGNRVKTLPKHFCENAQITSVQLPNSLQSIGDYAFYGCQLQSIEIPGGVQSIGNYAFSGCQLQSIEIPGGVQSIGDYAFSDCQLQSIEISSGVQSIGEGAFRENSFSLNSIKVQSGNPNYDSRNDCNALIETSSNTLLIGCKNTVIPNTITRIGEFAFYYCSGLTSINIPNSVTSIGGSAFSGCSGLTSINIPNSVTSIGGSAFSGCSGLTSIVLPNAVTVIESNTFYGCSALLSVEIGASVSSIRDYAFGNCNNLQSFISNSVAPPSLGYSAFYGVPSSMIVYVPVPAVESYQSAYIWQNYEIQPIGVGNRVLTVRFPDGTDMNAYTDMLLGIKSTDGEKSSHFTVSNKTSYTFSALDQDITWHVALTNQYDDVFGKIEDISLQEYNTSVTLDGLLKAKNVQMIVKTPDGQDVTAQCRVTWKDESGEILCQGNEIKRLPVGRKLYYQVVLPQQLATVYTLPATTAYTVKDGDNTIVCQLAAISQTQLSGRVKDAANNLPLYGATVSATQSFGNNNSRTITTTTDNQGAYAIEAAAVPTALTIVATGYMSQTVDCDLASGSSYTVPDVALSPITGIVLNVNLTYTPAHAHGEQVETQNWYSDYSNVDYEVYNTSTGQTLTGVHVQYPQIVLTEGANDGDVLEITATSRTNAFKPVKTTVTLAEQQATATFNILERGKIAAKYNRNINPSVTGTLYDSEDKMVRSDRYTGDALTIDNLDDGQYALITMGTSDFFNSIYDLEQFDAIGLQSGVDYVEKAVNVSNGIITPVTISEVPFLDETKFYYTGENTSFSVNKPNIVVGNYLTFRAQIDFKEQYANQVNDVQLIVDLPEGCPFYENSVMVGSNMGGYTIDGNRIIIPMTDYKAIVRFCAIPTVCGNYSPSAFVQFRLNGKTITQPIGNAPYTAKGLSISVPTITASTSVAVSGTAIGVCDISIYDNDVLIGQTTSLANGAWSAKCELHEPYNLSTHPIYAIARTQDGFDLRTETDNCFYDKNAIVVDNVMMSFYNGWMKKQVEVTFDFLDGKVSDDSYSFYMGTDITFIACFTNNDPSIVSNAVINVFTDKGDVRRLTATYDTAKDKWIAVGHFDSSNLPINVSVTYSYIAENHVLESVNPSSGEIKAISLKNTDGDDEIPAPPCPPIQPILDPSGFVYEGVPSNRLQGVTAICYYKEMVEDMYGDTHEEVVLWDAEQYGQENPLLTDENGYYRWDVPIGMWQVKYEKAGYETTYSDWLPVPPPQLNVNIGMVQMRQPEVIQARAYQNAVELEFDKFMLPETLTSDNIKVSDYYGNEYGTIELLNAEVDDPNAITSLRRSKGTGLTLASKVRFNADYYFYGNEVTLTVRKRVKSYAGLEMAEDYVVTLPIEYEMKSIEVDTTLTMPYGDSRQLTVTVEPATASRGKTLNVRTMSPMILSTDGESYTLDNKGQTVVTVHGDLPGAGSLLFGVDGYDLSAATLVKVMMENQMTVAMPTASIASGSEVKKGTGVYLRCSTEDATIYYTLDGSCPCDNTPARKVYDGSPIIIDRTMTIKAMATASDLYDSDVATFVYRISNGLKGDVNGDGEVNIADVNAVIGVILGTRTDEDIISRADVNSDGEVNIADVNEIIRIILGISSGAKMNVNCDDALHLDDVQMRPGEVKSLNVTLDNAMRYSALQCDIVLPVGLTLVEVNSTNGNVNKSGMMSDTTTRVMTYSMSKRQFSSNGSAVLSLTVRADAALPIESEISLTNVVLADNQDKAWHSADCSARVNNSSGINDLAAIADRVWVDGHTLFIETRQDGIAQLATINGIVSDIALKSGINQLQLEQGIYVVVINGKSHKIAIK